MPITKCYWILCIILFLACTDNKEKEIKIRLGVPPRANFLPVFIAFENEIFKRQGLNVEFISNEKIEELYTERKLDIICTGLTEPILFSSDGHKTKIVYRFSNSLASDIILSNKKYTNLEQLRKKKISFNGINSSSHIFVQQLLNKKGIFEGDYNAVNLSLNLVVKELENGNIDAGHTNGINLTEITKRGLNVVGRSADEPDLLSDTLSVDAKFLEKNPKIIEKIILSLLEASEFYKAKPEECISILANKIGKTSFEVKEELKGIRFLSIQENIQSLKNATTENAKSVNSNETTLNGSSNQFMNFNPNRNKGGLFIAAETIVHFLRERGQLYRTPDLKSIIIDTFVKNQEKNEIIP